MKLSIQRVSKIYGRTLWALRDFSLEVSPGVLGLLGPNGAGKSTLLQMLATVSQPNYGSITWNDIDIVRSPDELRRTLGYLPQDFGLYPNLNSVEFLEYVAAIKGLSSRFARRRIDELLQLLNLAQFRKFALGLVRKQLVQLAQL